MELILIGTSLLASFTFTIIVNRINKSNLHISRLKKSIELHEYQVNEVTSEQTKKIKEAYLEIELLIGKGQYLVNQLTEQLNQYQTKIEDINSKKHLLEELSLNIDGLVESTQNVNEQLASNENKINDLEDKQNQINFLQEAIQSLQYKINEIYKKSSNDYSELSNNLLVQNKQQVEKILEDSKLSFLEIKDENKFFHDTLENYKSKIVELNSKIRINT